MKSNIFLKYDNIANSRYFKEKNIARKFVIFFFIICLFLLILLEFIFFFDIFHVLKTSDISLNVYSVIISLVILLILLLAFISSFSQSLQSFILEKDQEFILSLPISTNDFIDYKFIKIYIVSSVIMTIFSIPLIFSYLYIFSYSYIYYIFSIIDILLISLLVVSSSFLLTSIINIIFRKFNLYIISSIFLLLFIIFSISITIQSAPNISLLFNVLTIKHFENIFNIKQILYSPQYLFSQILLNINYVNNTLILFTESISAFVLFQIVSRFDYLRIIKYHKKSFWGISSSKVILSRDLNHFINEEIQIFNSGIIIFILFFMVYIVFQISKFYLYKYNIYLYLGIIISISYMIVLLSLYFVFPSFSQEGRAGWIIFSSPIKRIDIFLQKIKASNIFVLIHAFILIIFISLFIKLSVYNILYFYLFIILTSLGISILFTSIGVGFPNFSKRDIQDLSTTPAGLSVTFISFIYVALPIYIFYLFGILISSIFFIGLFLLISIVSLHIGKKKIQNIDFSVRA